MTARTIHVDGPTRADAAVRALAVPGVIAARVVRVCGVGPGLCWVVEVDDGRGCLAYEQLDVEGRADG